jgi:hypothetical protein
MNLFKSKTYRNAERERNRLLKELMAVRDEKSKTKQTLNPAEYCGLIVKEARIERDLDLVNKILNS